MVKSLNEKADCIPSNFDARKIIQYEKEYHELERAVFERQRKTPQLYTPLIEEKYKESFLFPEKDHLHP